MALWKVEIYFDKNDALPSRTGYLNASNEDEAVEAATGAMGEAERADLKVVASVVSTLPAGQVLWVDEATL